jgi:hypothetical protein
MIVLFTDFGPTGPYTGQMKAVLYARAPGVPVVDLFCDAPSFNPRASAYLLAAYVEEFAKGTVFLCVVDPGVGGKRPPLVCRMDGCWFVGPGNGLFSVVARRARQVECWEITWRPARLSASFHGRDLFAPVAAGLAQGRKVPGEKVAFETVNPDTWPADLPEVIYVDAFGNAMTGIRAAGLPADATLRVSGEMLGRARTFSEVKVGEAFWYENANGLAEIAVNQGNASRKLGLEVGTPVEFA